MKVNMKLGNLFDFSMEVGEKKADVKMSAKRLDAPVWKFLNMEPPTFHSDNRVDAPGKEKEQDSIKPADLKAFEEAAQDSEKVEFVKEIIKTEIPDDEEETITVTTEEVENASQGSNEKKGLLNVAKDTVGSTVEKIENSELLEKVAPKGEIKNDFEINEDRIENNFSIKRD